MNPYHHLTYPWPIIFLRVCVTLAPCPSWRLEGRTLQGLKGHSDTVLEAERHRTSINQPGNVNYLYRLDTGQHKTGRGVGARWRPTTPSCGNNLRPSTPQPRPTLTLPSLVCLLQIIRLSKKSEKKGCLGLF